MNIGIFTDSFTPEVNGVVTSLQLFIANFQKLGHEVFIFAPNKDFKIEHSSKNHNHRYPSILIMGKQLRLAIPVIKAKDISALHLNIIHVQTPGPIGIAGTKFGKKLKIPLVYTYHTRVERYAQYYLHLPAWLEKGTFALIAKKFYNKHDAIIAPSEGIKKELEKFVTKPILVIPTGVDNITNQKLVNKYNKQETLKKYNLQPTDTIFITASRMGKEKNISFIIDAFAKIKTTLPNAKLLIAGNGPDKESLIDYSEQTYNTKDILFLGFLKHEELFSLYSLAKIFLFSSFTETQGMVVLEAMSAGLPVVALKATGVEDMLSDNIGGFITENNIEEFSQKVITLIKDESLWKNKNQEALQRAGDFSIEKMADKVIDLYNSLIIKKL